MSKKLKMFITKTLNNLKTRSYIVILEVVAKWAPSHHQKLKLEPI